MKSFVCSLCHNGILGGGLYLDSQSLTYKTNKLTVMENYINSLFSINHALQNGFKSILDKYKVSNSSLPKYLSNFPYFTGFSAHSLVK